jgi:hypothetical protein
VSCTSGLHRTCHHYIQSLLAFTSRCHWCRIRVWVEWGQQQNRKQAHSQLSVSCEGHEMLIE